MDCGIVMTVCVFVCLCVCMHVCTCVSVCVCVCVCIHAVCVIQRNFSYLSQISRGNTHKVTLYSAEKKTDIKLKDQVFLTE